MRAVRSGVVIAAPPTRVWAVLTDFARYAEWNPFIRAITGPLAVGARLEARLVSPGRNETSFRAHVTRIVPERELVWRVRMLIPGLFDGEHRFLLEPHTNGTNFRQDETFSGLLVRATNQDTWMQVKSGFEEMNGSLKHRAEALPGA